MNVQSTPERARDPFAGSPSDSGATCFPLETTSSPKHLTGPPPDGLQQVIKNEETPGDVQQAIKNEEIDALFVSSIDTGWHGTLLCFGRYQLREAKNWPM